MEDQSRGAGDQAASEVEVVRAAADAAGWERAGRPDSARALRVAVLVDLLWTPAAGGHVKFWERAARGAAAMAGDGDGSLDLTVYFAAPPGTDDGVHALSPQVRYRLLPPVFSTARLPFLSHVPDHTDLAPYHRRLARELTGFDVIHTTDAYFAMARTAFRVARRHGIPLVNSVHTDTPGYTRLYAAETVRRLLGRAGAYLLLGGLHLDTLAERRKLAQLRRHQAAAAFAFGPRAQDLDRARTVLPPERVLPLPRGLEHARFDPAWRDRAWLAATYGIAPDQPVVLCVGRVNVGKNVMLLAEAMRQTIVAGGNAVLICAGEGEDRSRVEALLGPHARCPGNIQGEAMSRLYASADLLAHPSEIETFANVVAEGMAAGLPALVSNLSAARDQVSDGVTGFVVSGGAKAWAAALGTLLGDPARRTAMGAAARRDAIARYPSWQRVVSEKLLPVWRRAAGRGSSARA